MSEDRNYEADARKQGWKPESEWEGDPPKAGFKTAEQFVKDGEEITGILKSQLERLESRVEQLSESNRQLNDFSKRALDKEKQEKDRLIKELRDIRKQALVDGDGDAFEKADEQIDELRSQPESKTEEIPAEAKAWVKDNPWYEEDPDLGAFADSLSGRLVAQGFRGNAYWNELTKRTKEAFPHKFDNPNRSKPNGVEGDVTPKSSDSKAKTFDNLPPDAKAQYKIFKRDIPNFTKEQYVEQYDWDE